jgi:hypothetical protein
MNHSVLSYLSVGIISLVLVGGAVGQPPLGPSFTPANLWMTHPVSWAPSADSVPTSLRQQRDQYFDGLIGLPSPITPANMKSRELSDGTTFGAQPEIPNIPNRAIFIATFASYQPVLSRSGRAIYTEIRFVVSNIFQDRAGNLKPGSDLVLIIPGGTIKTETGVVLSFLTRPRHYSVTAGGTYLLIASYHNSGAFYILGKSWDLSGGVVRRNFDSSSQTPSTLIGLSVPELIASLNAQFAVQ